MYAFNACDPCPDVEPPGIDEPVVCFVLIMLRLLVLLLLPWPAHRFPSSLKLATKSWLLMLHYRMVSAHVVLRALVHAEIRLDFGNSNVTRWVGFAPVKMFWDVVCGCR